MAEKDANTSEKIIQPNKSEKELPSSSTSLPLDKSSVRDSPKLEKSDKKIEKKKSSSGEIPKLDSSQVIRSKPEKKVSLLEMLNSWVLPIFSLIVLGIVSVLVLIPSANDTMSTLDEIKSTEDDIEKYENKIDILKSISISEVNSSLQLATMY